jgi:hypothetical protein
MFNPESTPFFLDVYEYDRANSANRFGSKTVFPDKYGKVHVRGYEDDTIRYAGQVYKIQRDRPTPYIELNKPIGTLVASKETTVV